MKNQKNILMLFFFAATCAVPAQDVLSDRAVLNTLLESQRIDEDFEGFNGSDGGATGFGGAVSATNGYPIVNGITISSTHPDPQSPDSWVLWNGNGFRGATSRTISTSYGLRLDFQNPTLAFGLDVKDYPNTRTVFTYDVTVFGADDNTVLYSNNGFEMNDPANGIFFGYQNSNGGIGSVVFTTISGTDPSEFGYFSSPLIDNLSFSTAPIPEPSTIAIGLLGLGALAFRWRKR